MWITHSYLGTKLNGMKCLVFLLMEDYIEAQSQLMAKIEKDLERFSRRLGHSAPLVKPFLGDIEETRQSVLDKNWDRSKDEIVKTPSLLFIQKDFNDFDPAKDSWLLIHLGYRILNQQDQSLEYLKWLLDKIPTYIINSCDVINDLRTLVMRDKVAANALSVVEIKPGIFGISVDVKKILNIFSRKIKHNLL